MNIYAFAPVRTTTEPSSFFELFQIKIRPENEPSSSVVPTGATTECFRGSFAVVGPQHK